MTGTGALMVDPKVLDKIDHPYFKDVFESIVLNEENHRQLLITIKNILRRKQPAKDNTPVMRYLNPDAWNKPPV